ncbi:MAG: DoxX family protein [Prevotellaceae bacterium]|nr:DoxX family protein [Prevotellaceae bacterium]
MKVSGHKVMIVVAGVMRLLLALTFVFSGVVKLIDPRGTQYKIEDYASVFGLSGLLPEALSLVLACLLAMTEFLIGIYLLFAIRRRLASCVLLCFMLVMTPLTLYLAIANPVPDCGCFGDAIVLTNWQTLVKNVILLVCAAVVFRYRVQLPRFVTLRNQWIVALYSFVFAGLLAGYCLWRLPVIDFRPYHVGADIRQAWIDDQQGSGGFVTTFILEKDGQQREFTLENYPDSTWVFVDSHTIQTGEARHSGVGDLLIRDAFTGEDLTETILFDPGYTFLLIAPYIEKADDGVMDRLLTLYDYSQETDCAFYCLTSSGEQEISLWQEMTGAEYPFCLTDAVVLKTMVRSNPGLMLLHDGKVVGKWPSTALPDPRQIPLEEEQQMIDSTKEDSTESLLRKAIGLLSWYIVPLIIVLLSDAASVMIGKLRQKHNINPNNN